MTDAPDMFCNGGEDHAERGRHVLENWAWVRHQRNRDDGSLINFRSISRSCLTPTYRTTRRPRVCEGDEVAVRCLQGTSRTREDRA